MTSYHPYSIFPLGDSALTIDFGNTIDEAVNKKVLQLFQQLRRVGWPYLVDLVPAYSSLTIHYDLFYINQLQQENKTAFETVAEIIENLPAEEEKAEKTGRFHEIPVCYSPAFALDAAEICQRNKISFKELTSIHSSKTYRVYMIGFLPGFPYLGETDERITIPRKTEPRVNLSSGSIGIAGRQTGIYPMASPGGWQIIGRTPAKIFDLGKEDPVLFQPGDQVKFYSITQDEFTNYQSRHT